ncbi:recombinase family protein [Streptomyces halobius]|uniref:Recombinase family protein n=1 Tax=Streptomyces halobius TaxID=2879846 RepID=A0ABY4MAT8_9ACTN|nr:recombinase family protein [Streptomyces halobius]UQA93466.1 recombinase family protein [Streptomyces halobius]
MERSGGDPNAVRPGCESLMDAVRAGEVDVVVDELSRLTRKRARLRQRHCPHIRQRGDTCPWYR